MRNFIPARGRQIQYLSELFSPFYPPRIRGEATLFHEPHMTAMSQEVNHLMLILISSVLIVVDTRSCDLSVYLDKSYTQLMIRNLLSTEQRPETEVTIVCLRLSHHDTVHQQPSLPTILFP